MDSRRRLHHTLNFHQSDGYGGFGSVGVALKLRRVLLGSPEVGSQMPNRQVQVSRGGVVYVNDRVLPGRGRQLFTIYYGF